ncbi:MAG: peptidase caspase catalytic subunit p20 [Proteobacteria bacterium]|nr:peptidase caspase catalytic subunit p20 [Pseudomonadota bacterium]MBS1229271.1 peptidase caspase catalytic subunit p20 [Pseudomonadota bacterium]
MGKLNDQKDIDLKIPKRSPKFLCCAVLGAALAQLAVAENHALLIGVSNYPALDKSLQLEGPANDVQLMRDLLKTSGFAESHIRVLADNVAGAAAQPTRAAILGELSGLANQAKKGDFVYLQFGGHGTQQPSRPGKVPVEADGLDELFLPRDVGKWDGDVGSVKNALVDEELGQAISSIRAKGAFVWAVFDSCHSGNVTRGGAGRDGVRERRASPRALGVPQQALDAAQAASIKTRGGAAASGEGGALKSGAQQDGMGGFVYFYAAQSNETAPEMRLPDGAADRKPYGVFTFSLAQVIAANPGISYRQAGERVLQLYAARNTRNPTPLFEGSGLDAPLFGQQPGDVVRQWKVSAKDGEFEISAGALQQFGEGAVFAVFPNAAAKSAETIGTLVARQVEVTRSTLTAQARDGKPALKAESLPRDATVRLVDPALKLSLRVALPVDLPPGNIAKVLDKLKATPAAGLVIDWVAAGEAADLRLAVADQRLWLLPPDGAWIRTGPAKTPSIGLDKSIDELQQVLGGTLQKVAKVSNLTRLSGQMLSGRIATKLDLSVEVVRSATGKKEEIAGATIPLLAAGDKLRFVIRNNHSQPVDLTLLGVDSLYGIAALYPLPNEVNRLNPRDVLTIPAANEAPIELDGQTEGQESIVLIAVEAKPASPTSDLRFLEQEGVLRERGGAAGASTIESLFADARDGGQRTRGAMRGAALDSTTMRIFSYRAQAKQ